MLSLKSFKFKCGSQAEVMTAIDNIESKTALVMKVSQIKS